MRNKNKNKHTAPATDADEVEIMDNVQEAETDN